MLQQTSSACIASSKVDARAAQVNQQTLDHRIRDGFWEKTHINTKGHLRKSF